MFVLLNLKLGMDWVTNTFPPRQLASCSADKFSMSCLSTQISVPCKLEADF